MSLNQVQFTPEASAALDELVERARRGQEQRWEAECEAKAATWPQRIADIEAMLDQIEGRGGRQRLYALGAAWEFRELRILVEPIDRGETRKQRRALLRAERRFERLTGQRSRHALPGERWPASLGRSPGQIVRNVRKALKEGVPLLHRATALERWRVATSILGAFSEVEAGGDLRGFRSKLQREARSLVAARDQEQGASTP